MIFSFSYLSVFSTYSRSYSVCFSFSTFFSFLAILQVLMCIFLIFHVFQCFLPYSRSYSVCVIFHVFQFSYHNPGPTVCVCHNFYVLEFSHYNPGPTVCISHISRFSLFLTIIQVLLCVFPILHVLQCFSPYSRS